MARKKTFRLPGSLTVLLILGLLALIFLLVADPLFQLDFGLIRTDSTASSAAVLTEVKDVFALHTVEYIHKSVFPHDFIPQGLLWEPLLRKRRDGVRLTDEDRLNLEVYDLCGRLGLSPYRGGFDFVVVTSIVKGGFDLSGTVYENPQLYGDNTQQALRLQEDGTLVLVMPPSTILDVIIEDSSSATYPYPDMQIEPEQWRLLTSFIRRRISSRVLQEGILDAARLRGEAVIRRLLQEAGFPKVVFTSF
ncbi:MAG: DUF4230 domain-containing protein [Spirochaetales bacterium]|nr:DUF4230 domain-containing protein [Spirochaetales bacterium]